MAKSGGRAAGKISSATRGAADGRTKDTNAETESWLSPKLKNIEESIGRDIALEVSAAIGEAPGGPMGEKAKEAYADFVRGAHRLLDERLASIDEELQARRLALGDQRRKSWSYAGEGLREIINDLEADDDKAMRKLQRKFEKEMLNIFELAEMPTLSVPAPKAAKPPKAAPSPKAMSL